MDRTPAVNSASSSEEDQEDAAGPHQGRPGQGRAGRTLANRAQMGAPSKGSTTAQNPVESSAARSLVTSTSPVASRPPTTARASSDAGRDMGAAYDQAR